MGNEATFRCMEGGSTGTLRFTIMPPWLTHPFVLLVPSRPLAAGHPSRLISRDEDREVPRSHGTRMKILRRVGVAQTPPILCNVNIRLRGRTSGSRRTTRALFPAFQSVIEDAHGRTITMTAHVNG